MERPHTGSASALLSMSATVLVVVCGVYALSVLFSRPATPPGTALVSAPRVEPMLALPSTATLPAALAATRTPLPTPRPSPLTLLDGSRVALVYRTFTPPEQYGSKVAVLSESQGALRDTTFDEAESPSWSPDGRELLLAQHGAIVQVDATTWHTHSLSLPEKGESDHWPQWSPDGQSISFVRALGSNTVRFVYPGLWQELSLWTMQSDGSRLRRMTPAWQPNGSMLTPSWSSDSTTLASPASSGNSGLVWTFVDVAAGRPITMALPADYTLWPADGRLAGQRILWAPHSAAGVIVFDWENGRCAYAVSLIFFDAHARRVTRVLSVPNSAVLHWSADGAELRFNAAANYEQRPGACDTAAPEPPRTFAVPRTGGPIRSLPPEGTATPAVRGAATVRIDVHGVRFVGPDGSEHSLMQFSPEFNLLNASCWECSQSVVSSAHRARVFFVAGRPSGQVVNGAVWSVDADTGDLAKLTADQDILEFVAYP